LIGAKAPRDLFGPSCMLQGGRECDSPLEENISIATFIFSASNFTDSSVITVALLDKEVPKTWVLM